MTSVPVYAAFAGPILAAAYYLWKVQHSVIGPMDRRVSKLERTVDYERQEREVCEWRHRRLVRWQQDQGIDVPDEVVYSRPPNANLPDPYLEEAK